jgi:hypothetical protein
MYTLCGFLPTGTLLTFSSEAVSTMSTQLSSRIQTYTRFPFGVMATLLGRLPIGTRRITLEVFRSTTSSTLSVSLLT